MAHDNPPRPEVPPRLASPLFYAISENDRQTIAMVREALLKGRVRLAYQPIVISADTSRIAFHEGLMRVLDPAGRPIPARDFMAAVEAQEIGRELDCASLAMALATLARVPHVRLSVNMSARSIGYPKWLSILRNALRKNPEIGERLILEITESSAMLVPEIVIAFMKDLQSDGVAFALDDFGAGYTAIRYFKDFAFDILKIDGQFIRNIHADADNQVLTAALVSIARQFDMLCVAESVETLADAQYLQALGVDCQQGYFFGAPTVQPDWTGPPPERQTA
ncbi:EAL domain-containing protein [Pseudorhodobacter sp. MZDSW-24AT]|uniref:EAL domain-containing protein n=1 Tax=Pseudorhodobacter sp. MZDSW-24AT TaxID=2052957 RepID=UPI000C1EAD22|nr:EAL domain-containing protein [Pseudorhodobacter sp. MZDSW-24AT]PJF09671.1 EAL domain-containing protein [Pseudorhodobacter sp. MZDSW-24AT]